MEMEFKAMRIVPDPIMVDGNVMIIGPNRYCAFTGRPAGACECWCYMAGGRNENAKYFVEYMLEGRTMPDSIFAIANKQFLAEKNAADRRAEQADYEHWAGEFGRAKPSDYENDYFGWNNG